MRLKVDTLRKREETGPASPSSLSEQMEFYGELNDVLGTYPVGISTWNAMSRPHLHIVCFRSRDNA
jgi:hypothetical protein